MCVCVYVYAHSVMSDSATSWTVAFKAPLSMEFSRQKYWSGLPFPSPGDIHDIEIKPVSLVSPALAGRFFTTAPSEKPTSFLTSLQTLQG